ncbi:hypothetical protein FA95DRAFT_1614099 [Auriscalpium vulgare]|uniref:Uncharacterized protein n=1 Tax=Auriscalpium vulgare TaxID=40419 RepID=A0ACB8R0B9_9AGAM|nr:hypothetical protein FA95DRAFT_1614099 [Auriscalpium vulgare]
MVLQNQPVELVEKIFRLVADEYGCSMRVLLALSGVNRYLREVALHQGDLWTHIDMAYGPRWTTELLERSKHALVDFIARRQLDHATRALLIKHQADDWPGGRAGGHLACYSGRAP